MSRMLVTGGAGFIGSNFIRYMLSKYSDLEIINLDLLTYSGRTENLLDIEKDRRYSFIRGDIRQKEIVAKIVSDGIDVLVNFAAETHVDRSISEAGSFVLTDVYGTYILLDIARKYDVDKFLQISTDEVYGSIITGSFDEKSLLSPSSPYSASKSAGDLLTQAFHKTYNLHTMITRSSNNFGAYQHPEKLIPKLILRAIHNNPLPLYGDGKQVRDWIYVIDNCEAIDIVIKRGESGQTYNIASRIEQTNLCVAQIILKALSKPESLLRFVKDRPGHDRRYSIDVTKIESLGWKPKHIFEKTLKKTIDWYKDNNWWWKPLIGDIYVQSDTPWLEGDTPT